MGRVLFLMLCMWAGPKVSAQATLRGQVTDPEGRPIPWSNIRVLALPDSSQAAYAYADGQGAYSVAIGGPGRYLLRFNALAFQVAERAIAVPDTARLATFRVDAVLTPAPFELEEVIVRAEPPMRVGKDTVAIRVSAFATGSERVVEDLLKRLPGIEVGADGSIRVRGKAVSKVLIEGDDLFDKGYTLLTKNLNAGVLDRVEVIKRYSDNPVLRDLQQSEAVALNLRLKEEVKGALFGKGFLGGSPETYDSDLNLIRVRRRNKAFFLGNLNNSGRDATGDLQSLLYPQVPSETPFSAEAQPLASFLAQPRHQTGLPQWRTRSNNAELASLSGLFSPGEAFKVKSHFYLSSDEQTLFGINREVFRTDSVAFENTESEWVRNALPLQSGRLEMQHTTPRQRLEWLSELQTAQPRVRRRLLFNGAPVSEDSREVALQVHSRLSFTRRLDSATALLASFYYAYNRQPLQTRLAGVDWGELTPSGAEQPVFGHVSSGLRQGGLEASLLRANGRWQGRLLASYAFHNAILFSDFTQQGEGDSPLSGPEYRNRAHNRQNRLQGGVFVTYAGRALTVRGRVVAQYLTNQFRNAATEAENRFALVPLLSFNWQPGKAHYVTGSYTYGFRESTLQEHYSRYVPGGFRLLQRGLGGFQTFRSHRWLLNYTYGEWGDPYLLSSTFLYNREPEYAGSESQIASNLVRASARPLYGRENFSWNGSYDQYLKGLASNLKVRAELQVQRYESLINTSPLQNELLYLQAGPELRTVFNGGFNVHGGVQWSLSRFRGNALSKSRSQSAFLDLEYRLGPWLLELSNEGYRFRDAGLGRAVWFSDLGVSYTPKEGRVAFRAQLTNSWNIRILNYLNLTETGRFENRYALRPRQLVIGLDFRF